MKCSCTALHAKPSRDRNRASGNPLRSFAVLESLISLALPNHIRMFYSDETDQEEGKWRECLWWTIGKRGCNKLPFVICYNDH